MPMLDPIRVVVPVRTENKAIEHVLSFTRSVPAACRGTKNICKGYVKDAPREQTDVSHMLQVPGRARQQRG